MLGMITGGFLLCWIGFPVLAMTGAYWGIFPAVMVLIGLALIVLGTAALVRRAQLAIHIRSSGIELPAFNLFQKESPRTLIRSDDIVAVSKHESLKGRLIEIRTRNGERILVQARHYCSLDQFISHCKGQGLPVE